MGDEKIGIRRLEHYDLHGRVRLEVGHERSQFGDRCGNKHVDRRIVEGDRPKAWIAAVGVELRAASWYGDRCAHGLLLCRDVGIGKRCADRHCVECRWMQHSQFRSAARYAALSLTDELLTTIDVVGCAG